MDQVRAAVCRGRGELFELEDLAIGDPRPDEVLVRFTAAGLCHTDLEVAAGRMPTPLPVVAGHEGAGVIEAVGPAVSGLGVGDRVVASFSFCGTLPCAAPTKRARPRSRRGGRAKESSCCWWTTTSACSFPKFGAGWRRRNGSRRF